MEKEFFKIFGKVLKTNKPKVSFLDMNKVSILHGLFVPKELCYEWLYELLRDTTPDYNSTFYQKWEDVTSKTRFELAIDQLMHYASTYGTDFQGEAWLPERTGEAGLPSIPYSELKVVEGITEEDACEEIKTLAYSNIAMKQDTLKFLAENKHLFDIDKIKNRQLKLMCIDESYKFKDGQECLLFILYKFFDMSMLVKNTETLRKIKAYSTPEMKSYLENNKVILSSIFYRNKDVFMCFKHEKSLCGIVNKIRKLACKYHKPMKKSIWLKLQEMTCEDRHTLFSETSIFKLVQMYNALNNPTGYYVIRNGKAYFKSTIPRKGYEIILYQLLSAIVDKVPKVESVALPKGIELAMPMSEKNFIGDIPIGSYIDCADNNTMVGIYWRNEWGANDLDLHVMTAAGQAIGWNSRYNSGEDIVFSGDMTFADPEATEIMWFKKEPEDSIVSVNEFRGFLKYEYDLFIAQEKATNFEANYMVNPDNVIYKAHMEFEGKKDNTIGYFHNNQFTFHSCNIGGGIVPGKIREDILAHLQGCKYLTIREVLENTRIKISDDAEIKLTSKGELINFFTEQPE